MRKLIAVVALLAITAMLIPVHPAAAQDEETCWSKGGNWDAETESCAIQTTIEVKMNYPMEFVQDEFAAATIDDYFATIQQAFFGAFAEYGMFYSPGPLALDVSYTITPYTDSISSILFTIYEYTGGAHGNTTFQSFVFDTANQRVLTLGDVIEASLPEAAIAGLVQDQLREKLGDMTDEQWILDGTSPTPENYANWILTVDGLVFTFPPYQVAAYAAGPQEVTIPWSALEGTLMPEFTTRG